MQRPVYTPQFKNDVVARASAPGVICSELAIELDIGVGLIYKWRKEKAEGKVWRLGDGGASARALVAQSARSNPPHTPAPSRASAPGELEHLRTQVSLLTAERDKLKGALAHYLLHT